MSDVHQHVCRCNMRLNLLRLARLRLQKNKPRPLSATPRACPSSVNAAEEETCSCSAGGGAGKSSGASGCMTMTKPVFSMRFLVRRSNGRCAVFWEVFRRSGAEPSRLVLHSTLHLQALFNFLGLFHWCRLSRRMSRVGVEQACVLSRGCAPVCQSHC